MLKKDQKLELAMTALIVAFVVGLYLVFSSTVYDCSKADSKALSSSLNACFEKEALYKEMTFQEEKLSKEIELKKEIEKHKTCRLLIEQGKTCEKELLALDTLRAYSNKSECDELVKATLCEPKMFLWKLFYF